MNKYVFEEQTDVNKRVRWGAFLPEDIEANMHLVKKGEKLLGEITGIAQTEFDTDELDEEGNKKKRYAYNIMMSLDGLRSRGEKEVQFIAPVKLQTALGLNPNWKKMHIVKEGDIVEIEYLGKEGRTHEFNVKFAKK